MPIKIKKRLTFKEIPKNVQRQYSKAAKPVIADLIIDKITQGISPVKGEGRFTRYSKSYSKKKGRRAPVDMLDTGKMLESIRVRLAGKLRKIEIFFKSKIAGYHTRGDGKLPMRKLLPTEKGETFTNDIIRKMIRLLDKTVSRETKR